MDFGGRYLFATPRPRLWTALNDATVLGAVIPGCVRIEWTGPTTLDLSIRISLGPVHPTFKGALELSNIQPAERYTLSGRGRGGLLGLAHAAADITLADDPGGTLLSFEAVGNADGGIMRLGRSLVGHSAQGVIDGFFGAIGAHIGVAVTPVVEDTPAYF